MTRGPRTCFALLAACLASCETRTQQLTVELNGPPTAARFVAQGNCFLGWYLILPLRVRGENASLVSLESMNLSVEEARSGRLLGQEDVALDAQLPGGDGEQMLDVPVNVRIAGDRDEPAIRGPVVVRGEARGRDPDGALRVPFRLDTVPVVTDVPVPRDGACTAPL